MGYSRPTVYLAGPIHGLSPHQAKDWRRVVASELEPDIISFSPLRAKDYLDHLEIYDGSYEEHVLSSAKGLTERDVLDCTRVDLVMVNLAGAPKVSIGTMIEIGLARAAHVPIVLIIEPEGNPHDHPMVRSIASWAVMTLSEAIHVTRAVLLP